MGAGIAALTLLPMGIIFTVVGRRYVTGHRVPVSDCSRPVSRARPPILSVSGGNVVVNNINVLLTFRLRVSVPGRPPYELDHRQLTSMFSMAALQVGRDGAGHGRPDRPAAGSIIDLAGVGRQRPARRGRCRMRRDASPMPATVQPNTLSTMGARRAQHHQRSGLRPGRVSEARDRGATAHRPGDHGGGHRSAVADGHLRRPGR